MSWLGRYLRLLPLLAVAACGGPLPGFYWDLEAVMDEDLCNASPVASDVQLEYRVLYDVQDITIAIGEDEFATGTAQGCTIDYETVVWPDTHGDEEYDISWKMDGSASVSRGGTDGCTVSGGIDWDGTEVFTIVTSADPNLSPGCTYTVHLTGTYSKEVK